MFYSAVVAAAGLSSRMKAFKPHLPLADGTVIGAVITTLKRAGVDDIVVVTGYKADEMAVHLEKHEVRIVENKLYAESEMFDSIKLGLKSFRDDCRAVFITTGDVPLMKLESLKAQQKPQTNIVRPVYQGKGGHPVLISKKHLPQLLNYSGDKGLKGAILSLEEPMIDLEVDDPGVIMNLNTPEEFAQARIYEQENLQEEDLPENVPSYEEILTLWDLYKTPSNVRQHMLVVEKVAAELAAELATAGKILDHKLICAAALLHDLCRTKRDHEKAAGEVLRKLGYSDLAHLVESHNDGSWDDDIDEAGVLYLADKQVLGSQRVTIEERFAASYARCKTELAKQKHGLRFQQAEKLHELYEQLVSIQYY